MFSDRKLSIIVVDNASQDRTPAVVNQFKDVLLLSQGRNLGFARANNIGIQIALEQGADYVLLLNQDATIYPNTVTLLVECARAHPNFGVLSPLHLNGSGTELDLKFGQFVFDRAGEIYSDLYFGRMRHSYRTTFVNAAAWLLTADCLRTVGGFDPLFFMYGEDADFCNRVLFHGFEIGIVPDAIVLHGRIKGPSNAGTGWRRRYSNLVLRSRRYESDILVGLKHPSRLFLSRFALVSVQALYNGLEMLFDRDIHGLFALVLCLLHMGIRIPSVWRHRAIAMTRGPHWLNGAKTSALGRCINAGGAAEPVVRSE